MYYSNLKNLGFLYHYIKFGQYKGQFGNKCAASSISFAPSFVSSFANIKRINRINLVLVSSINMLLPLKMQINILSKICLISHNIQLFDSTSEFRIVGGLFQIIFRDRLP